MGKVRQFQGSKTFSARRILNIISRLDVQRPTPERRQHMGGLLSWKEPEAPRSQVMLKRWRAAAECQLDLYWRAGKLSAPDGRPDPEQYAAGIMFRQAWLARVEHVQVRDSTLAERIDVSNGCDFLAPAVGAERILKLCYLKLSAIQKQVMRDVCGTDQPLGSTARVKTLSRALVAIGAPHPSVTRDDHLWLRRRLEQHL